jgi:DNA-binding response OmpR family regulator
VRILIVEDEQHLALGLRFNFEAEGYAVDVVEDGNHAVDLISKADPPIDLIVLDLMLPGMSGYEICEQVRLFDLDLPVIVLSARTLSEDKARAFDVGVDQYVTKPFHLPELLSRVRNLLRRRKQRVPSPPTDGEERLEFGSARIDFKRFQAWMGDEPRRLTPMEMKLVKLFADQEGVVLSRKQILTEVWDMDPPPETRTVDNFVMRLRKHFEIDPANPRHFQSVRGAGYRFVRQ